LHRHEHRQHLENARGVEADPDVVAKGIKDVLSGSESLVTEDEARKTLMAYQQNLRAKQDEKRKGQAEKNKAEGEKFLTENKAKPGIVTPAQRPAIQGRHRRQRRFTQGGG